MHKGKAMTLTILGQNHLRQDWKFDFDGMTFDLFFSELVDDLAHLGIRLDRSDNREQVIDINSYADLLSAVKVASPADGFTGICIGHIIGKSPNCDILEDIRRGVNRIAFAPETVHPEESNLKVCHNCGCGC